jgi:tripartite-type tricarboxylate transporter receptor subunit TctC
MAGLLGVGTISKFATRCRFYVISKIRAVPRVKLCQVLTCAFAVALGSHSFASFAQNYPSRPITVVSPYAAGGDADFAARNFAAAAQKILGQAVVVVNRPGASGVIGSAAVVSAATDGYTLLLARPGSQSILPAIMPSRTKYKWDDYTMIGLLELNPYGCFVKANKFKNYADFAAGLKSRGKQMNFGTAGTLTTNDMGPRQLFKMLGLGDNAPTQIPYKASNEAMVALLSGEIDFACASIGTFVPMVKNGDLMALIVTTPERVSVLPDTPTARELGLADLERIIGWSGIFGPAHLPQDIQSKLQQVMKSVASDASWIAATEKIGSIPYVKNPEETRAFARDQFQLYRSLGESLRIIDKAE